MKEPKGLIQVIDARCYELYKNGMRVEGISEKVGIPAIHVKEAIQREKVKNKILNKKEYKMNNLNIKLLSDNATIPTRANPTDSGLDLYVSETVSIPPKTTKIVKTDIAIELPIGYEGQVRPRSGTSLKTKLRVALGTIDQTYHKEIGIITDNISDKPITVEKGQRLAQLVIAPVQYPDVNVVKEFKYESDRSGYGSTGI